ncbi:hypothetical protein [Chitinimonas sp.]|uniref:hypothetical protein n=1 Tax=Chitinimonas sp. TaxID=1934313 RepID=UPI0035B401E4
MSIQPLSRPAFAALSSYRADSIKPSTAATTAKDAATVSISAAARARLAAEDNVASSVVMVDTNHGTMPMDLENYFKPNGPVNLDELPLLLPSRKNVDALTGYISSHMPGFLARNGIPSPPASVSYDENGALQLPASYSHAEAFKQALSREPTMERTMRTAAALSSHLVGLSKLAPYYQEMEGATSQAAADAIVEKYRHLLSSGGRGEMIALNFSSDGKASISHNGKSLDQL